jgi:ectoine hydroxylase-related dioxygenase (phytanoyl-CoA dioxygenase family)
LLKTTDLRSDKNIERLLDEKGYYHDNFLSETEVDFLLQKYIEYSSIPSKTIDFAQNLGYYISVFDENIEKRKFINTVLKNIFTEKLKSILPNYKILYGNFMTKEPNGSEIEVHQDFSFVDEKKNAAYNFWIPLQYTDCHNGGFHLIEGSHHAFNSYRSASIPHNITHYNELFKSIMQPVPVEAGDGLIFDHRLFHYSSKNLSTKTRIAVQMVLIPENCTPVMYYYNPDSDKKNLSVYEISEEYLLANNLWQKPEGLRLLYKTPYEKIPDGKSIYNKLNGEQTDSFLFKIKSIFQK